MASYHQYLAVAILLIVIAVAQSKPQQPPGKVINVEVGGHCSASAAPTGPGGSWQVIDKDTKKVCPPGTTCRTVSENNFWYCSSKLSN